MKRVALFLVLLFTVVSIGTAVAHTEGAQHLNVPKPPKPFHNGLFFGVAKTVCDSGGGVYGVACVTSRRVVKVTAQMRTKDPGTGEWDRWVNVTDEKETFCEQSTGTHQHCREAETVGMVSHDCVFGLFQYRTRVKAGYKKYSGVWLFSKYKYSDPADYEDCG